MSVTGEDLIFGGVVVVIIAAVTILRRMLGIPLPVRRWAREHDLQIIECVLRTDGIGPFAGSARGTGQNVFHIRARALDGKERRAWLLCDAASKSEPVLTEWDE